MMKEIKIILLSLACISVCFSVCAEEYDFIHFSKENGLAFNSVRTLVQDTRGVMWIGTYNGLNSYDGQRFRTYGCDDLKTTSAFISCLYAESNGDVLVGTDDGLTVWDFKLSEFIRPEGSDLLSDRIFSMCEDSKGRIWVGTRYGLYVYSNYKLSKVSLSEPEYNSEMFFRMAIDKNDQLFAALYCKHIICCDVSSDDFTARKFAVPSYPDVFDSDDVEGLAFSPNTSSVLYVASKRNGLCELNLKAEIFRQLLTLKGDARPVSLISDRKYLWLSTTSGLVRYDLAAGSATTISSDINNPFSLSGNHVTSVYSNAKGKLWIGTEGRGLNVYEPSFKFFKKVYTCSDGTSLLDSKVTGFAEDRSGVIWFSTKSHGLFQYDRGTGRISNVETVTEAIPSIATICIADNTLWMGYQNGVSKFEISTGIIRSYPHFHDFDEELDNRVIDIIHTYEGDIYLGTAIGLMKYDWENDDFRWIESVGKVAVNAIEEDAFGILWLATYSKGIMTYDPRSDSIIDRWCSTMDNGCIPEMVQTVAIDKDGQIYGVGFNSGFAKYNAEPRLFEGFNANNVTGLSNDSFLSVLPDDEDCIWLSADRELVRYNVLTGTVRSFSDFPYLLSNSTFAAMFKCKDGTVMIGSDNGFLEFSPSSLKPVDDINFSINIMDLIVGGQLVKPSSQGFLKSNVDILDNIRIPPGNSSFGFTFATPKSEPYERNEIYCRLEGYDDWNNITSRMEVAYERVPAGKYRLSVATILKDGTFVRLHDDVDVEVKAYFLNTFTGLLVIILSTAFCALIVFAIIYYRQREKYHRQIAAYSAMISRGDKYFLSRLDKIVSENLSDPNFTVQELEEAMYMSRSSLTRKMHVLLNSSPVIYLRTKRLEKAASMLQDGKLRIKEVCFAVGFKSHSYFTKCFKEKFGMFPAEYVVAKKR